MTIDWWTLGFQVVNVAVLVWLLTHFFWKPVAAIIEARRAAAAKIIADAQASEAAAKAAQAEIAATRAGFAAEHERILADARKQADEFRARLTQQAEADADRIRAEAKAAAEARARSAEKAWADRAADLAVTIAAKLLAPQDDRAIRARFLEGLIAELQALPDAERRAATAPEAQLTATTASRLDGEEEACARRRIGDAIGGSPTIAFETDPAILSGLELAGPGFVVKNSWRADLDRIRDGLTHGQ
jgi:F-type H+-transporting ATPase subunit b